MEKIERALKEALELANDAYFEEHVDLDRAREVAELLELALAELRPPP